jgi:superfamily II DNA or RNA helicase
MAVRLGTPSSDFPCGLISGASRACLMDQWRERLAAFLALPIGHVGQYGGGKARRTGLIDVAVIQSLHRKGAVKDFVAEYGHVIVDECHHL